MKGLHMMLKAFGVEITPEQCREIEALIPQLPGKVNEVLNFLNQARLDIHQRLFALETRDELNRAILLQILEEVRRGARNADNGGERSVTGGNARDKLN